MITPNEDHSLIERLCIAVCVVTIGLAVALGLRHHKQLVTQAEQAVAAPAIASTAAPQ